MKQGRPSLQAVSNDYIRNISEATTTTPGLAVGDMLVSFWLSHQFRKNIIACGFFIKKALLMTQVLEMIDHLTGNPKDTGPVSLTTLTYTCPASVIWVTRFGCDIYCPELGFVWETLSRGSNKWPAIFGKWLSWFLQGRTCTSFVTKRRALETLFRKNKAISHPLLSIAPLVWRLLCRLQPLGASQRAGSCHVTLRSWQRKFLLKVKGLHGPGVGCGVYWS